MYMGFRATLNFRIFKVALLYTDKTSGLEVNTIIIKITISSLVIGLKKSYFPLIHLESCYRTVCYWIVSVSHAPPVIQTSVNFSIFNLHFLSWYYTWNAETLQGYWSKGVLPSAGIHFQSLVSFNLLKFSAAILEKGLFSYTTLQ